MANETMEAPPPSPKKQKTEGEADHDHEPPLGAVEPPPSSSSSSPSSSSLNPAPAVTSAEEELPLHLKYPGINPKSKYYKQLIQCAEAGKKGGFWWSAEEDEEARKEDTAIIAQDALDFYNDKEGVKYVMDQPGHSRIVLFPLAFVYHLNFTARKEEGSLTSELFFAERVSYYGGYRRFVDCVKLDSFPPDRVRKGCIYCRKAIYHPPVENCEFGTDKGEDNEKFLIY